ncbi:major facilitator superfamily domain-containing protein [Lasiosphaeris hirsuta]|uniref:Major facilitator superfamily domain-containing protein n=1 Tax=Lasiosphaeris hirsuta TaxID=260670 RepID=A0AA40DJP3_9PEZI|nr:major facilitator superfamily domain-containing protein [Lasiosphaeris hirsuta]
MAAVTVGEKEAVDAVQSPRSSDSGSKDLHKNTDRTLNPAENDVADLVKEKPHTTWRSYFWDSLDKSPEERRFLLKLDAAILTVGTLAFFLKYLDQVNINNAFVSGMREDLGFYGLELNYMQTAWTVGYILGEIPSNLILTRIRPSYWLPACEVAWSVLTFLLCKANTPTQFYVLRFFIGLFESTCYPGIQYVIGSWYRKDELAKRSCIFHASGYIGFMFSGYLMAAVYNLEGVHGFRGWQWLFIIDGVISLPIAAASFFFLPDVPETTKAWYFSEDEVRIGKKRMELEGRASREPYTLAKIKRILSSWHIWLLSLLYIVFNNATGGMSQPTFPLWLKSQGYSVWAINVYPTFASVIGVICTLSYAWVSDTVCKGARWPPIVFASTVQIIGQASLAAWDLPSGWKWFCFLSMGMAGGTGGMSYAWAHEITSADSEERALVTAAMNQMASVVQAWLPLLVWRVTEAPRYFKGFVTMTVLWVFVIVIVFVIRHLQKREIAQKSLAPRASRV